MEDADTTQERALSKLERMLASAQEITHIGSFEWDMASGSVTWSDELYRIYGMAPRSVVISLDYFLSRVHPEDRDRVQGAVRGALERGGRFAYRERIVRPDGSVRELDTIGEVVVEEGAPRGLIGTCRDVTEERRREETIRLYADIVDHVQIGLSMWRADSAGDPNTLRLIAYNRATEAATGVALAGMIGKTLPQIFPMMTSSEIPSLLASVGDDVAVRELPMCALGTRTFAAKAFAVPDRAVGLALEDVTARVRALRVQAGEKQALELLAAGAAIGEILGAIVAMIEEIEGTIASVLLLDETGTHMRHGAAPHLPADYNRAIDGAPIGPKAGSCGTAAYRREPVIVGDIATDPLWDDYRALALPHGLRACWSWPILATDGGVLGTFAIYAREPSEPDEDTRELIARAAHVAGIAIERRLLDDRQRALSARLEAVREDERTNIAREIHDELGQSLTALKMDLAWIARRARDPSAADAIAAKLDEMSRATDEIVGSVRRISAELRPGILDDLGLRAAIEWQAEEFERRTGVRTVVKAEIGELRLERGLATTVFRIYQEALTNVARHAGATRVDVSLSLEKGNLRLEVVDDGVGVPAGGPRSGALGLLGMRERALRAGGDCLIERIAGRGTRVRVTVPLKFPAEDA
ncbi:MAG TPA: GAF domain-containing protein [Kofleriaceae bacterium]|nr:GAF domain-containing protein [Kofleriaceae bacterium]